MKKLTKIKIYGKPNCPYCKKAKELVGVLKDNDPKIKFEYFDIEELGLTKEQVAELVKQKEIKTYPQILFFFDDEEKYMGGYDDTYKYVMEHDLL